MAEVLAAPHWQRLAVAVHTARTGGVPDSDIRIVDRWLRHRATLGPRITEADVRVFKAGVSTLHALSKTLALIDPGNPDNRVIQATLREIKRKPKPRPAVRDWNGLPEHFRRELDALASLPADRGLSRSSLDGMCAALRRLVAAAAARGLEPVLDTATATAFAEGLLHDGELKATSRLAYLDFLARFARHAGYSAALTAAIVETMTVFRHSATKEVCRKEIALSKDPVDLIDIAARAHELLERAPALDCPRDRRRHYALAGATALLSKLQLRSLDLRSGRVGHEFRRDSEGWKVDLTTSKTGTPIRGRLAPELTRYLDAVLLQDTDPAYLWILYDERSGQSLFGNACRGWDPYSENWLWSNMRQELGHGPHIVRSLIYEACVLDDDLDLSVARALCGHRTAESGKPYDINGDRHRRRRALDHLGAVDRAMRFEGEAGQT